MKRFTHARTSFVFAAALLCAIGAARAQDMQAKHHTQGDSPSANWAQERLAKSPRHQEWVKVKSGAREINCFLVYPEVKDKATSVVVIHEIFGMSDWVQLLTDEMAEAGFVAIAPDLLSGMGPGGGGTAAIAATGPNAVGQAIRDLPPAQIAADLNAVADFVAKLPAANGKVAAAGFCWGGSQTFLFATQRPDLKAALVFYGAAPTSGQAIDKDSLQRIAAPVYGFYAENDARIDATIPATTEAMKALGKKYEPVTYAGAGHGFMRAGDAPSPVAPVGADAGESGARAAEDFNKELAAHRANRKARNEAWTRVKEVLRSLP
jgi:carboxymethylenebutenolidase